MIAKHQPVLWEQLSTQVKHLGPAFSVTGAQQNNFYLLLPAFRKILLKTWTATKFKVVFFFFIVGNFTWRPPYTTWIAQARSKIKSDQGQEVSPLRQNPDKPTPAPHDPRLSL